MGYNPPHAPSGCIMTVTLKNGIELVERVEKGPWEPPNVPTQERLREKFVDAAAPVIGAARARDAFDVAISIGAAPDLAALTALLRT
jgi:hypothetical protein